VKQQAARLQYPGELVIDACEYWLRGLNPWSPAAGAVDTEKRREPDDRQSAGQSVDCGVHDPPRFGLPVSLYSQAFYDQLARVLKPRGRCFTTPVHPTS